MGIQIDVSANTSKAQYDLQQLNKSIASIEKSSQKTSSAIAGTLRTLVSAAAFGGVYVTLRSINSEFNSMNNRLKLVIGDFDDLAEVQNKLLDISRETRRGVSDTVRTYSRLSQSLSKANISTRNILKITTALNKSIAIDDGPIESANAALIQLGQGLSAGALRGEELNSVMEQLPRFAQVLRDELGASGGKLREMAADGKITADVIYKALINNAEKLNEEFRKTAPSIAQVSNNLNGAIRLYINNLDKGLKLSSLIAKGFQSITDAILDGARSAEVLGDTLRRNIGGALQTIKPLMNVMSAIGTAMAKVLPGVFLTTTLKGQFRAILREVDDSFGGALTYLKNWKPAFLATITSTTEQAARKFLRLNPANWFGKGGWNRQTFERLFSKKYLMEVMEAFDLLSIGILEDTKTWSSFFAIVGINFRQFVRMIGRYVGIIPDTLFFIRPGLLTPLFETLNNLVKGFANLGLRLWEINRIFYEIFGPGLTALVYTSIKLFLKLPLIFDYINAALDLLITGILAARRILSEAFANNEFFDAISFSFDRLIKNLSDFTLMMATLTLMWKSAFKLLVQLVVGFVNLTIGAFKLLVAAIRDALDLDTPWRKFVRFGENVTGIFEDIYSKVIGGSWAGIVDMISRGARSLSGMEFRSLKGVSRIIEDISFSLKRLFEANKRAQEGIIKTVSKFFGLQAARYLLLRLLGPLGFFADLLLQIRSLANFTNQFNTTPMEKFLRMFPTINEVAREPLLKLEAFLIKFAVSVINVFKLIYDKVIGHSYWTDMIRTIRLDAMAIWNSVAPGFTKLYNGVIGIFWNLSSAVSEAVSRITSLKIFDNFMPVDSLSRMFRVVLRDFRDFFGISTGLVKSFVNVSLFLFELLKENLTNIWSKSFNPFGFLFNNDLSDKFGAFAYKIKESFESVGDFIMLMGKNIRVHLWAIKNLFVLFWEALKTAVESGVSSLTGSVSGWFEIDLGGPLAAVKRFARGFIGVFEDIYDKVIGNSYWTDTIDAIGDSSQNLWSKVKGGVGKFSGGMLKSLTDAGKDFLKYAQNFSKPFKDIMTIEVAAGAAVASMVIPFLEITKALNKSSVAARTMALVMLPLTVAMSGLNYALVSIPYILATIAGTMPIVAAGFYILHRLFPSLEKSSIKWLSITAGNIRKFADNVIDSFAEIYDRVIGHSYWTDLVVGVVDGAKSLGGAIIRALKNPRQAIEDLKEYLERLTKANQRAQDGLVKTIAKFAAWQVARQWMFNMFGLLGVIIGQLAMVRSMMEWTTSIKATPMEKFLRIFPAINEAARDPLLQAEATVIKFATNVIAWFAEIYEKVIGHSYWTDTMNGIVDKAHDMASKIRGPLTKFKNDVVKTFKDVFDAGNKNSFGDKAKQIFENVKASAKSFAAEFPTIINGAIAIIGIRLINRMFDPSLIRTGFTLALGTVVARSASLLSEKIGLALFDESFVTAAARQLGKVIGLFIGNFIKELPDTINSLLALGSGIGKGILESVPIIGKALGKVIGGLDSLTGLGGPLGIIGAVLLGRLGTDLFTTVSTQGERSMLGLFDILQNVWRFANGAKGQEGNGWLAEMVYGTVGKERFLSGLTFAASQLGAFDSIFAKSPITKLAVDVSSLMLMFTGDKGWLFVKRSFMDIVATPVSNALKNIANVRPAFQPFFDALFGGNKDTFTRIQEFGKATTDIIVKTVTESVIKKIPAGASLIMQVLFGKDWEAKLLSMKFTIFGWLDNLSRTIGEKLSKTNIFDIFSPRQGTTGRFKNIVDDIVGGFTLAINKVRAHLRRLRMSDGGLIGEMLTGVNGRRVGKVALGVGIAAAGMFAFNAFANQKEEPPLEENKAKLYKLFAETNGELAKTENIIQSLARSFMQNIAYAVEFAIPLFVAFEAAYSQSTGKMFGLTRDLFGAINKATKETLTKGVTSLNEWTVKAAKSGKVMSTAMAGAMMVSRGAVAGFTAYTIAELTGMSTEATIVVTGLTTAIAMAMTEGLMAKMAAAGGFIKWIGAIIAGITSLKALLIGGLVLGVGALFQWLFGNDDGILETLKDMYYWTKRLFGLKDNREARNKFDLSKQDLAIVAKLQLEPTFDFSGVNFDDMSKEDLDLLRKAQQKYSETLQKAGAERFTESSGRPTSATAKALIEADTSLRKTIERFGKIGKVDTDRIDRLLGKGLTDVDSSSFLSRTFDRWNKVTYKETLKNLETLRKRAQDRDDVPEAMRRNRQIEDLKEQEAVGAFSAMNREVTTAEANVRRLDKQVRKHLDSAPRDLYVSYSKALNELDVAAEKLNNEMETWWGFSSYYDVSERTIADLEAAVKNFEEAQLSILRNYSDTQASDYFNNQFTKMQASLDKVGKGFNISDVMGFEVGDFNTLTYYGKELEKLLDKRAKAKNETELSQINIDIEAWKKKIDEVSEIAKARLETNLQSIQIGVEKIDFVFKPGIIKRLGKEIGERFAKESKTLADLRKLNKEETKKARTDVNSPFYKYLNGNELDPQDAADEGQRLLEGIIRTEALLNPDTKVPAIRALAERAGATIPEEWLADPRSSTDIETAADMVVELDSLLEEMKKLGIETPRSSARIRELKQAILDSTLPARSLSDTLSGMSIDDFSFDIRSFNYLGKDSYETMVMMSSGLDMINKEMEKPASSSFENMQRLLAKRSEIVARIRQEYIKLSRIDPVKILEGAQEIVEGGIKGLARFGESAIRKFGILGNRLKEINSYEKLSLMTRVKLIAQLERQKEIFKTLAKTSFGESLSTVNSIFGTSFTDKLFAGLPKSVRKALSSLAQDFEVFSNIIKNTDLLDEEQIEDFFQKFEDASKNVKLLELARGMQKSLANLVFEGYKEGLDRISSLTGVNNIYAGLFSQKNFEKFNTEAFSINKLQELTNSEALKLDVDMDPKEMFRRLRLQNILNDPNNKSATETLKLFNETVKELFTPEEIRSMFSSEQQKTLEAARNQISALDSNTNALDQMAEDLRELSKLFGAPEKEIKRGRLAEIPEIKLPDMSLDSPAVQSIQQLEPIQIVGQRTGAIQGEGQMAFQMAIDRYINNLTKATRLQTIEDTPTSAGKAFRTLDFIGMGADMEVLGLATVDTLKAIIGSGRKLMEAKDALYSRGTITDEDITKYAEQVFRIRYGLSRILETINDFAITAIEAGKSFQAAIEGSINTGLQDLLKGKRDEGKSAWKTFVDKFLDDFTNTVIDTFVGGFTKAMMSPIKIAMQDLGENLFKNGGFLGDIVGKIFGTKNAKEPDISMGGIVTGTMGPLGKVLSDKPGEQSCADAIKTPITDAMSNVKSVFGKVPEIFEGIWGSLKTTLGDLFTFVSQLLTTSSVSSGIGGMSGGFDIGSMFSNSSWFSTLIGAGFAKGGLITGPGTGTSDSVPFMGSAGEFVVRASATRKFAPLLHAINSGRIGKYAEGGVVGMLSQPSMPRLNTPETKAGSQTVVNLTITGDISRQTKKEIYGMLPSIAEGVNGYNKEKGYRG